MNGSSKIQNKVPLWRILVSAAAWLLVFGVYIYRLFSLQIVQGPQWLAQAEENRTREINLPAQRGVIYDRNGIVLARNVASYHVIVTAADLPDDAGAVQEIFRNLSELIDLPVNQGELSVENPYVPCISDHGIAQIVEYGETATPYTPVRVKCFIDRVTAMIVQEKANDWPGVSIEIQPIREYPTGSLTASIIGFLGPIPAVQEEDYRALGLDPSRDKVGYAGVELEFQDLLAGQNGKRTVEVDSAGKELRNLGETIEPEAGLNLHLTIESRLQQAATLILQREINYWNTFLNQIRSTSGVVVAMNPATGEILAMVSYPTYENNRMAREIPAYYFNQLAQDAANPLLNHAVGDTLPAGSVFKLATAVGGLNEGIVTPDQIVETPGKLTIIDRPFTNAPGTQRDYVDWVYEKNPAGFGQLDFLHCIANSSNVCFYKVGGGWEDEIPEGLGICRLGTYARALGYGDYPGIELPEEEKGLIPDPQWKRITHGESWSLGDTYISSVGQGFVLATPLQVLMSAATIANDGKLMQPTLVREILDGEGNVVQPFQPRMKWDVTRDPVIQEYYETTIRGCEPIEGSTKTISPEVIESVQQGMRLAVTEGTLKKEFSRPVTSPNNPSGQTIIAAGKTGTAEYCDKYAQAKNLCIPGSWPTHSWTVAYAPYDNPEIAVVAFVYNGGEGASVAGPIVWQVINAYFDMKKNDAAIASSG
ncbi:MAG: penicillin-binding protein 2 [Chloroflexi bacterium]|nr:penicillin-binding protein 2 [Chloroflexota bacterium]